MLHSARWRGLRRGGWRHVWGRGCFRGKRRGGKWLRKRAFGNFITTQAFTFQQLRRYIIRQKKMSFTDEFDVITSNCRTMGRLSKQIDSLPVPSCSTVGKHVYFLSPHLCPDVKDLREHTDATTISVSYFRQLLL